MGLADLKISQKVGLAVLKVPDFALDMFTQSPKGGVSGPSVGVLGFAVWASYPTDFQGSESNPWVWNIVIALHNRKFLNPKVPVFRDLGPPKHPLHGLGSFVGL